MHSVRTRLDPLTARVTQVMKAMEQTVQTSTNAHLTLITAMTMLHVRTPKDLSIAHVTVVSMEMELIVMVSTCFCHHNSFPLSPYSTA